MAEHDATQSLQTNPIDDRGGISTAIQEAHGALIGATAVLAHWLSMDANDPRASDFDSAAEPVDSDFALALELLLDRADTTMCTAMEQCERLRAGGDMGAAEVGLADAWTIVGGIKQLVHAAGLACDAEALRPEAGAALLAVLARIRDEVSERGRQVIEADVAAA
jgi:hypothetical protein